MLLTLHRSDRKRTELPRDNTHKNVVRSKKKKKGVPSSDASSVTEALFKSILSPTGYFPCLERLGKLWEQ